MYYPIDTDWTVLNSVKYGKRTKHWDISGPFGVGKTALVQWIAEDTKAWFCHIPGRALSWQDCLRELETVVSTLQMYPRNAIVLVSHMCYINVDEDQISQLSHLLQQLCQIPRVTYFYEHTSNNLSDAQHVALSFCNLQYKMEDTLCETEQKLMTSFLFSHHPKMQDVWNAMGKTRSQICANVERLVRYCNEVMPAANNKGEEDV